MTTQHLQPTPILHPPSGDGDRDTFICLLAAILVRLAREQSQVQSSQRPPQEAA